MDRHGVCAAPVWCGRTGRVRCWWWHAAENCIVVAEGALQHNGVFRVDALGFPPPETRAESQAALKVL